MPLSLKIGYNFIPWMQDLVCQQISVENVYTDAFDSPMSQAKMLLHCCWVSARAGSGGTNAEKNQNVNVLIHFETDAEDNKVRDAAEFVMQQYGSLFPKSLLIILLDSSKSQNVLQLKHCYVKMAKHLLLENWLQFPYSNFFIALSNMLIHVNMTVHAVG